MSELLERELARIARVTRGWTRDTPIERMRRDWDDLFWSDEVPVESTTIATASFRAEALVAPGARADRVVLYLHGGGFSLGSARSHHDLAARLSAVARCRVVVLEYRRVPEFGFPAPVEDAVAAARCLIESGVSPGQTIFAGDSAGGGLVLSTMLALRAANEPLPAGGVLLSPWVDLSATLPSYESNAERDPQNDRGMLRAVARRYLGEASASDPIASPLLADLRGLPPLLVQVGDREVILDDSRELARRVRESGGSVDLEIHPGMVHVFQQLSALPEASRALDTIGAFMETTWK